MLSYYLVQACCAHQLDQIKTYELGHFKASFRGTCLKNLILVAGRSTNNQKKHKSDRIITNGKAKIGRNTMYVPARVSLSIS